MTVQILMIEDDDRLALMVGDYLRQSGYGFVHCGDGATGLAHLQKHAVDLIILDLMLPDIDGLQVCQKVRAMPSPQAQTAILMLTAKGDPMDRIVGLELGADDYVPKPFEPRELLARIKAILRRKSSTSSDSHSKLVFGSLEIDRDSRTVSVNAKLCDLTSYQFDLLVVCSHAIKLWRLCVAESWRPLIDRLTFTWDGFGWPLKTITRHPSAY